MEALTLIREAVRGFEGFVREFSSGIFALLGIMLGAWLSRRSELMRLRVERRTQIFDEACKLTAEYYVRAFCDLGPMVNLGYNADDNFIVSAMSLDRKIFTHFSGNAHRAWRRIDEMIGQPLSANTATAFADARASALNSLGKELRR
jgi:hypothetical protein